VIVVFFIVPVTAISVLVILPLIGVGLFTLKHSSNHEKKRIIHY
jgi:hypothetical protein